mmetsp:Transcript_26360/g.49890  ORF Transcript_26360/g.49890 Transcript_26360/m.49890 type:complete len:463 (-) Transcript_26360:950-2338(-)
MISSPPSFLPPSSAPFLLKFRPPPRGNSVHLLLPTIDWLHLGPTLSEGPSLLLCLTHARGQISFREPLCRLEHLLVGDETLQNRPDRHPENFIEHFGGDVRKENYQEQRTPEAVQVVEHVLLHEVVADHCGGDSDEELADYQDEFRDDCHCADPQDVPQDQEEGLPSGLAEAVPVDGSLNVSVLVHEFHALLEAPHVALDGAERHLQGLVLALLGLVLEVGDDGTNGLDDGDDETTEGGGAEVVPHGPLHRREEGAVSDRLLVPREVPRADGHGDDELAGGDDELARPEPAEEHVKAGVLHVIAVREGLVEEATARLARALSVATAAQGVGVARAKAGSTDAVHRDVPGRGQVQHVNAPGDQENDGSQHLEDRVDGNDRHSGNGLARLLDDSNGEHDALPEAADDAEPEASEPGEAVGDVEHHARLRIRVLSVGLPSLGSVVREVRNAQEAELDEGDESPAN